MLAIFVFNTPGEHIKEWAFYLSPTYEGLQAGLLQLIRMLALLAVLSLVMAFNTSQQLVSGFYFMALPLQYLGLKIERFAARLWLTLHYVESVQPVSVSSNLLDELKAFGSSNIAMNEEVSIIFKIPVFKVVDIVVIFVLILIASYMLVRVFT